MANVYLGPHCEALKLTCQNIDEGNILIQYKTINNGVVLQLHKYLKSDLNCVINILQKLCTDLTEINPQTLHSKINHANFNVKPKFKKKHKLYLIVN